MPGKTIFLAAPFGMNVRDVLRSDVLKTLRASGNKIVLFSPAWNRPEYVEEFKGDNISFEPLYTHTPGRWETFFDSMRFTLFADLSKTFSLRVAPRVRRSAMKKLAVSFVLFVTRIVGRKITERVLAFLNLRLFPDPYYKAAFEKYRPDLVILCRIFNFSSDYQLLKRAKVSGVPTLHLVSSWDNLTNKGVFPVQPDRLVVWSEMQLEEATGLHLFRPEQVFVGGGPQFDAYCDLEKLPSREEFFRRIGADPNKKLITLAMGGRVRCPHEFEVVELLMQAIAAGRFREPVQLLARLHPMQVKLSEAPEHLKNLPDLLFDVPGKDSVYEDRDPSLDDLRHLAATMRYSDIVLNTASTTTLDASIFDTPVVCLKFDGFHDLPYLDSVRRFYDFTHYSKLMSVGQIPIAENMEALVQFINRYLADPSLERENRARMVRFACGQVDGRAGERVGRHIIQIAENRSVHTEGHVSRANDVSQPLA